MDNILPVFKSKESGLDINKIVHNNIFNKHVIIFNTVKIPEML
jgi:hypothetical protein